MHPPEQTFAYRLEHLFATRPNPHSGRRYSDAEVAVAVGLSKTAVWNLRKGQATNPTRDTIRALADHFGVNPSYFFGDETSETPDAELRAAMRDAGVRQIAARAVGLSADSQRMVLDVLDQIRRLEQPGT